MTTPRRLSPALSVAAQIDPAELPGLAAAGFRSILSNRPDGEEPGQPSYAEIAAAARQAGLEVRHVPVVSGKIGDGDVAMFRQALDELPAPVLAFCRSGTRCTQLWALASAGALPADEIVTRAAAAGYDLSALRGRLGQA